MGASRKGTPPKVSREVGRGIDPNLLVSQVKNTAPYLFEPGLDPKLLTHPATQTLLNYKAGAPLSHEEYFGLCIASHILSCATPVPTDVDNQIRQKLWDRRLPDEVFSRMASLVLEIAAWDFVPLSARYVYGSESGSAREPVITGHAGEWFTIAAGAYCALKERASAPLQTLRADLFDAIHDEVIRHSEVFGSLWRAKDGLGSLKASASIAHNFGDLDRVMDMWELEVSDPLRLEFYKLTVKPFDANRKLRHQGRLWVAGELYKSKIMGSSMAAENHRHYALRKPRVLRSRPEFRVPTGPFFDDWGRVIGMTNEHEELVEVLTKGWERQPGSLGYGRALVGIKGVSGVGSYQSFTQDKDRLKVLSMSQELFESTWSNEALVLMDDIPSRAK